ncbi:hypothetical protein BV25DRAFT_1188227 [Artomyces pyxidatus]|uniref:Uncharacterized protein n=1 Tax=Artomyces pyxidatus TaxID=48021 RepID=A0ACB8SQB7_9AGAM|nr:hypothetical protein BV25DRAFT_1188227 [Artomyces pyxidatus]
MAKTTFETDLTIPRINRLLRPLRNKCANLAAAKASASTSATQITYGSRGLTWTSRDTPPLCVLPDPKNLLIRAHSDRKTVDELTLSRQIYTVVDAFRNVLQAAFGNERTKFSPLVLDLTDLCAAVVGKTIREEVAQNISPDAEEEDDTEMAIIDELYESVPLRFRKWTLVSHAFSLVIETCPHHPTLMTCLLDMALFYRLPCEAHIALRSLLAVAIRPSQNAISTVLICHPAHPSYLVDLCKQWTSEEFGGGFSVHSFVSTVIDVLTEYGGPDAWTCKAVRRLAWQMRAKEPCLFLRILTGLAFVIGSQGRSSPKSHKRTRHDVLSDDHTLVERLVKWLKAIPSSFPLDEDTASRDHFEAVVEFVSLARSMQLHICAGDSGCESPATQMRSLLTCIATQCLASPMMSACGPRRTDMFVALLREAQPGSSDFSDLTSVIFTPPLPAFSPVKKALPSDELVIRFLERHADVLRQHSLCALEAALWTCALWNLEHSDAVCSVSDKHDARKLRSRLVDAVAEVEKRLYASQPPSDGLDALHWEWEDLVGCWVRMSSPAKRFKPEPAATMRTRRSIGTRLSQPPRPRRSTNARHTAASFTPLFSEPSSTAPSSTTSSTRARSDSPITDEGGDTILLAHGCTATSLEPELLGSVPRRIPSFKSILADAMKQRKDLRAERRASLLHEAGPLPQTWVASESHPSSDDALDLFTCDAI